MEKQDLLDKKPVLARAIADVLKERKNRSEAPIHVRGVGWCEWDVQTDWLKKGDTLPHSQIQAEHTRITAQGNKLGQELRDQYNTDLTALAKDLVELVPISDEVVIDEA